MSAEPEKGKRRILITGSNGLIGRALSRRLAEHKGFGVTGVGRHASVPGDICLDFAGEWSEADLPERTDVMIHLAQSENFRSFPERAQEIFSVNTVSTLRLLEYARKAGVQKFIYASSGGVYGNSDTMFQENSPLTSSKDLGFYLSTKFCSELLVENYYPFFEIVILRFFFVFGPAQKQDMLIPRLVRAVKSGTPITIQGEEGIRINPIYVEDAVTVMVNALSLKGSHKFNVAGFDTFSLRDIIRMIGEHTGHSPVIVNDRGSTPKSLLGDITKMKELLPHPEYPFSEAIKLMI
jgi:UDP-glucose 4-epimerase